MSQPLVSVVIAAYNAARFLPAALDSVFRQTHPSIEIIVVDDGSTDDTAAILAPFQHRITILARRHAGLAAARNAGIAEARGEFIALLDADDLWQPEKLSVQLAIALRLPDAGMIVCDGVEFEGDRTLAPRLIGKPLDSILDAATSGIVAGRFHGELLDGNAIFCPAQVLIPRRVADLIGPFSDLDAQDHEYYLRIAQLFPVVLHRDSLARWRYRPDSMSGPREARGAASDRMLLAVLRTHRNRCTPHERRRMRAKARELVHNIAFRTYQGGLGGDGKSARKDLATLRAAWPWGLTTVPFSIALSLPATLRLAALRIRHALRRRGPG